MIDFVALRYTELAEKNTHKLITATEYAKRYNYSLSWVCRRAKNGDIPAYRSGGRWWLLPTPPRWIGPTRGLRADW